MKVRNWKQKAMATIATGGALVAAAPGLANADTTLDFVTGLGNAEGSPDTYGDNAPGTFNVVLLWHTADSSAADGWDSYTSWDGRGEVGQMDMGGLGPTNPLTVTFTPDAGFGVFVESFDLDEFAGGGNMTVAWEILDGANSLFSGIWDDFNTINDALDDGGRSTITTGMTSADALFGPLVLSLSRSDGFSSYVAMDNLTFGQVGAAIPEPNSLAMIGLGLGAMFMRRKRDA